MVFSTPSLDEMDERRRKQAKEHYDRNEEYRRDIAKHCDPEIQGARDTDQSAIELGQSIFKTSTLLNGGAIIAIPAVVGMFGIDAHKITTSLMVAGGLFALGLISSWLSAICGFLALSNRADRDYSIASKKKWEIYLVYFPPDDSEDGKNRRINMEGEQKKQEQGIPKFHKAFFWWRLFAILSSVFSLIFFCSGSFVGGSTMLNAPIKTSIGSEPTTPINPTQASPEKH